MIKLLFKKKTRFELLLFEDYKFIPFRLWLKKTKMDTEKPFDLFLSYNQDSAQPVVKELYGKLKAKYGDSISKSRDCPRMKL